jgi:hypothetical protein
MMHSIAIIREYINPFVILSYTEDRIVLYFSTSDNLQTLSASGTTGNIQAISWNGRTLP